MVEIIFYLFIMACVIFTVFCLVVVYCLYKLYKISNKVLGEKTGGNNVR